MALLSLIVRTAKKVLIALFTLTAGTAMVGVSVSESAPSILVGGELRAMPG
jgi:hypothetical protein